MPQPSFLTSDAPARIDEFRRFAEPQITEQFRGGLLEQFATFAQQQRTQQRQTSDQLSSYGVNPAAFYGRFQPELNQASAERAGGLRGAAISGEAQAQVELRGNLLSALNQIEAYYDSLQLQNFLAAQARETQMKAARASGGGSLW